MIKSLYVVSLLFIFNILYSQDKPYSDYYKIRLKYEDYAENDIRALVLVNKLISKAKKEYNNDQLAQGYRDALFYSPLKEDKLKYADSTIVAAQKTQDNDLLGNSYLGKGIVYYFNYRRYQPALDEYLQAYKYLRTAKDPFQKYQNLYHIGVVKSYLGYYDEATKIFQQCITYFQSELNKNIHPNLIFNNKKGYLNSLHQLTVCYRNLNDYKKADSIITVGLSETNNNKDYNLEQGYFLKERGIEEYRKKYFTASLQTLHKSIMPIRNINDFAWSSVSYFYIGKSYLGIHDQKRAVAYFQKVDSVFNKQNFMLPELRQNYELLIDYYKKEGKTDKELYYTKQLLKADSIISKDFSYLSTKIHRDYDTKTLQDEKTRLELKTSWGLIIIFGLIILIGSLIIILIVRLRIEKQIRTNYQLLEEKIIKKNQIVEENNILDPQIEKNTQNLISLDQTIVDDLLIKLRSFEENNHFIKSGITLNKLAGKFGTNSNYLSQVINDNKGMNFNRYLSELRINYITEKLYNDKKYLNYKIETLAEICGIASRTNFSNLFQEINGIRPTDFIKKRNEDLDKSVQLN